MNLSHVGIASIQETTKGKSSAVQMFLFTRLKVCLHIVFNLVSVQGLEIFQSLNQIFVNILPIFITIATKDVTDTVTAFGLQANDNYRQPEIRKIFFYTQTRQTFYV